MTKPEQRQSLCVAIARDQYSPFYRFALTLYAARLFEPPSLRVQRMPGLGMHARACGVESGINAQYGRPFTRMVLQHHGINAQYGRPFTPMVLQHQWSHWFNFPHLVQNPWF